MLTFPSETRAILHPFSDESVIAASSIPTYSLQEILAEKIRAIAGQRRFAISRDVYDIHKLLAAGVTLTEVLPALPAKFRVKGMRIEDVRIADLEARRPKFKADWDSHLTYLLPPPHLTSFEDAWETVMGIARMIAK